jgi:tRNA A-37 threonylcarbamoyl transferase component Bud32
VSRVENGVGTTSAQQPIVLPDASSARVHRQKRQRRPTGAPPPLPRALGLSGKLWLGLLAFFIVAAVLALRSPTWLRLTDHVDTWWLKLLANIRVGWLTRMMDGIKIAGSGWGFTLLGLGTVALLMIFRRWRHLFAFLLSILILELVGEVLYVQLSRPRPYGVAIIGKWGGFSLPSPPVAVLVAILVGMAYTLVVPGRPRWYAKLGILGAVIVFGFAREYLALDHPSDLLFGVILGVAIPVAVFRLITPNEAFPVVYRRGSTAHLDVTGKRALAIREAIREQLGLIVLDIKPVGLASSGGSTPLRLRIEGDPDTYLFAKLYAKSHVRADRWYKVWRTILYGALEDEASFQTVRRFVEYEDHMLRLIRDSGVHVPAPYGIVEITPGREYMLVMEFFDGAVEIGEAEVDDGVIEQGLQLVRQLWDAGLAHRDIKPGNLMVRDGNLLLIDVFFVQVRPSPWRQAVDLGNMMLVLAVRSEPERVYQRALKYFTADEIAEAFAATRGVASPTQLRAFMKRDPRDLLEQFRRLAPERPRIAIQRWSARRVAIALGMVLSFALVTLVATQWFFPLQNLPVTRSPECGPNHATILEAQAVPSAASVPCIAGLPSGWRFGGAEVHTGLARFWLDSDRAGVHAVTVALRDRCDISGAEQIPSDEPDTTRFEKPSSLTPRFTGERTYLFPGGCATYTFSFAPGTPSSLIFDTNSALSFTSRASLVKYVEDQEKLALCGRGARCPG